MIYSVGYERLVPAELQQLASRLNAVVLDVRSAPSGHRVKRGFRRDELSALLGARYEWRGAELGGRGRGPTKAGIASLRAEKRNALLLCQEQYPWQCHRHLAIAVALLPLPEVVHVVGDDVYLASDVEAACGDLPDGARFDLEPSFTLDDLLAELQANAAAATP